MDFESGVINGRTEKDLVFHCFQFHSSLVLSASNSVLHLVGSLNGIIVHPPVCLLHPFLPCFREQHDLPLPECPQDGSLRRFHSTTFCRTSIMGLRTVSSKCVRLMNHFPSHFCPLSFPVLHHRVMVDRLMSFHPASSSAICTS